MEIPDSDALLLRSERGFDDLILHASQVKSLALSVEAAGGTATGLPTTKATISTFDVGVQPWSTFRPEVSTFAAERHADLGCVHGVASLGLVPTNSAITANLGVKYALTPDVSMFAAMPRTDPGFGLRGVASLGLVRTDSSINAGLGVTYGVNPEVSMFPGISKTPLVEPFALPTSNSDISVGLSSAAPVSTLAAIPAPALGFAQYSANTPEPFSTHAAISIAALGVTRWNAGLGCELSAITFLGRSSAHAANSIPDLTTVNDLKMSPNWDTHAVEDPRDRDRRTELPLRSSRRRKAKLRRMVTQLRRQVTDLRAEVEEQRTAMAEWFEWLESQWFEAQLAPPPPDDRAFDV